MLSQKRRKACLRSARLCKEVQRKMYAVIKTGGKQYRVQQGDVIYVEKLDVQEGDAVKFDVLMLGNDDTVSIGAPVVKGAKVVVYKYKAKKNERKKQGHRQPYTKVEITAVQG